MYATALKARSKSNSTPMGFAMGMPPPPLRLLKRVLERTGTLSTARQNGEGGGGFSCVLGWRPQIVIAVIEAGDQQIAACRLPGGYPFLVEVAHGQIARG